MLEFVRLAFHYSAPMYWSTSPRFYADQLTSFLLFLLDPQKPGIGVLRPHKNDDGPGDSAWLDPDSSCRWVADELSPTWHEGAQVLHSIPEEAASELVFQSFIRHKAEVFFDGVRLGACLGQEVPDATYCGFSIDWARTGTVLWAPQLRVENVWSDNGRWAPSEGRVDPPGGRLSATVASRALNELFAIGSAFNTLRERFRMGYATLNPGGLQRLLPPVFFSAWPELEGQQHPEDLLGPPYLSSIETLARSVLRTHDIFSTDVSGAFLEGNLLTFRREIDHHGVLQPLYLIVSWAPSEGDWTSEIENEIAFVSDKLAYIETEASYQIHNTMNELALPQRNLSLWGGTLDTAAVIAAELQRRALFQPRLSLAKRRVYRWVQRLRGSISRLETRVLTVTDDLSLMKTRWSHALEQNERYARRLLTVRELPRVQQLWGNLGAYRFFEEFVFGAARRGREIREHFLNVERALQDILDQQQREERGRQERTGRLLGLGLAALAVVTALPLIIGEMSWDELQTEMSAWPPQLSSFAVFLERLHTPLTIATVVLAFVVFGFLLGILGWTFLQDRFHEDALARVGQKIVRANELMQAALPLSAMLTQNLRLRQLGEAETDEVRELRRQLHGLDIKVCSLLADAWDWVKAHGRAKPSRSELDGPDLAVQVDLFVILTELIDNRVVPIPLPMALCLYSSFEDSVTDVELTHVLRGYGFGVDEIEVIKGQVARSKELPPAEFVQQIGKAGVTAMHERRLTNTPPDPDQEALPMRTVQEAAVGASPPLMSELGMGSEPSRTGRDAVGVGVQGRPVERDGSSSPGPT